MGANSLIIKDGENGFLAGSDQQWIDRIEKLINDPALRRRIGEEGRRTVEEKYSLRVSAPRIYEIIQKTHEEYK